MAVNKILSNGTLGGSNAPGVVCYSPTYNSLFVGTVSSAGDVAVSAYGGNYRLLQSQVISSGFAADNHCTPALLVMDPGGTNPGKILAAYSHHAGSQFSQLSSNANDIRSWGAAVPMTTAAAGSTFNFLFQTQDTARTVWNFTSLNATTPNKWGYYTSTDGVTWSAYTNVYAPAGAVQPILCPVQDPSNADKIHWFMGTNLGSGKIYHFYMAVQADASVKWFKSDGTDITATLGTGWTDETHWTPIYTTAGNAGVFSAACVSGVPAILYFTSTASGSNTTALFTFFRAKWNGSSWDITTIAGADSAANGEIPSYAGPDYLAHGSNISGYPCLDPNNLDKAYVPVAYASNYSPALPSQETTGGLTDLRLEEWDFSGGVWSKAADVTGAVSTLGGVMTLAVPGLSPTQLVYTQGTYSSFTSFNLDLWASPSLAEFATKTAAPSWSASVGPLGTQAYYLLYEGSGTTVHDVTGAVAGYDGAFVGTPAWGSDTYGPNLGTFSTSNYAALSGRLATDWAAGAYPKSIWFVATNAGTAVNTTPLIMAQTAANTSYIAILFNVSVTNGLDLQINGNNNTATVTQLTDGNPHVYQATWTDATHVTLTVDGVTKITATNSIAGNTVMDRFTAGCYLRSTGSGASAAFTGSISSVGVSWGGAPEPNYLYRDLITGQFGGTRAAVPASHFLSLLGCGN